jgi:hypothetical protein
MFAVVAWPATGGSSMLAYLRSVVYGLWVQILLQDRCVLSGLGSCLCFGIQTEP